MEQSLVELVWQRAHSRCEYCQLAQAHSLLPFEVDHIIARKHDGATVPENLSRRKHHYPRADLSPDPAIRI